MVYKLLIRLSHTKYGDTAKGDYFGAGDYQEYPFSRIQPPDDGQRIPEQCSLQECFSGLRDQHQHEGHGEWETIPL